MQTDDLIRLYIDTAWRRRGQLAPKTVTGYRDSARFLPKTWPTSVNQLSEPLTAIRRLSVESQRTHIRRWKTLGRWATKEMAFEDPFAALQQPRAERKARRTFSPVEFASLLDACDDDLDRALVSLLFGTGIRVGEVPLRSRQFSANAMSVRGKSGAHDVAVEAEVAWEVLRTGNGDCLWLSPRTGRPLSPAGIKTRWRRLAARAKLTGSKIGPHTARHTFSTTWLRGGGDLKKLSEQLGHASIRTTEIYTHLTVEDIAAEQRRVSPLKRLRQSARYGSLRQGAR